MHKKNRLCLLTMPKTKEKGYLDRCGLDTLLELEFNLIN